jgi:CheY-like chemotaxis protein
VPSSQPQSEVADSIDTDPGEHSQPSSAAPLAPVDETPVCRRVLVIEDNVDAAEALGMFLEVIGHAVRIAHSGRDGVAIAREWRPEIVLSDIGLPGEMDGYQVARALREVSGTAAYLVALSGYGQEQDKQRAKAAGFDAHMTKPVDAAALEKLLASC